MSTPTTDPRQEVLAALVKDTPPPAPTATSMPATSTPSSPSATPSRPPPTVTNSGPPASPSLISPLSTASANTSPPPAATSDSSPELSTDTLPHTMQHIDLTAHLQLPHGSLTPGAPQFSPIRTAQDADDFTEGATRLFTLFLILFTTLLAAAFIAG